MALPDVRILSDVDLTPEERLRRMLKVELEQEGADPSGLLLLLERAVKEKIWVSLGLPSFAALIEEPYPTGLGWCVEDVRTMMNLRHKHEHHTAAIRQRMDWLRKQVTNLITDDPLATHGEIGGGHGRDGNTKSAQNDATYALRRLKRDRPDLAKRVLAGELSAHAAAVEAGFRHKTMTVPLDPEKLARAIRRRLTDDEVITLIDALGEGDPRLDRPVPAGEVSME